MNTKDLVREINKELAKQEKKQQDKKEDYSTLQKIIEKHTIRTLKKASGHVKQHHSRD